MGGLVIDGWMSGERGGGLVGCTHSYLVEG